MERINLRYSSFIPNEELSWNKEITQEAPISAVSPPGSALATISPCLKTGLGFLSAGIPAELAGAKTLPLFILAPRCFPEGR